MNTKSKQSLNGCPFRWPDGSGALLRPLNGSSQREIFPVLRDRNDQPVLLSESIWNMNYALQHAPGLELFEVEPL